MGDVRDPLPVLLLIAASSRHEEALVWGLRQSEAEFGPAAAVSDAFDFTETNYYDAEMGVDQTAVRIDGTRIERLARRDQSLALGLAPRFQLFALHFACYA